MRTSSADIVSVPASVPLPNGDLGLTFQYPDYIFLATATTGNTNGIQKATNATKYHCGNQV